MPHTLATDNAGQIELRLVPTDLRTLLVEVTQAHRPQAAQAGLSLALDTPRALPLVLVDREPLTRMLGDLLTAALRRAPRGGGVQVRVTDCGHDVVILIANDRPERKLRLFDRLWRRALSGEKMTDDTLELARRIVTAHQGRLWSEPDPGGGYTVSFTLIAAALA